MAFDGSNISGGALPRTMDAARLNEIANDPAIRRGLGQGMGRLDFTDVLAAPHNYAFADERGGFMFIRLEGGSYELHTLLAPTARGVNVPRLLGQCFRWMFTATDCVEVKTRVPGNLRHADLMARRVGFRELWTMANAWPGPDGEPVSLRLFVLSLEEWMMRDGALVAEGEAFHAMLREAANAAGSDDPLHPHEDEVHERAAGMACAMAKAGNHQKAVWAYGRWAEMAGYFPVRLLTEHPATYDTGNALLQAHEGKLEIVKWWRRQ